MILQCCNYLMAKIISKRKQSWKREEVENSKARDDDERRRCEERWQNDEIKNQRSVVECQEIKTFEVGKEVNRKIGGDEVGNESVELGIRKGLRF